MGRLLNYSVNYIGCHIVTGDHTVLQLDREKLMYYITLLSFFDIF